jgi:hypothetical protein
MRRRLQTAAARTGRLPRMQTTATPLATTLELPQIDSNEPVAVVPLASVAPPDGRPDGERTNLFTIAPATDRAAGESDRVLDAMVHLRDRVLERPLTTVCAAFTLGLLIGRVLR